MASWRELDLLKDSWLARLCLAAPALAVLYIAYYQSTPRAKLIRLCRRWSPSAALRAKKLLEATAVLAPLPLANDPDTLDTAECMRRILGSRPAPTRVAAALNSAPWTAGGREK